MGNYDFDIGVLGGGAAGLTVTAGAAQLGAKTILIEKERPIGVQILGVHAGDLLGEWVAVLNGKVKLSTLAGSVHPYPTLGEISKRVAGTFLAERSFQTRLKRGLNFFSILRVGPVLRRRTNNEEKYCLYRQGRNLDFRLEISPFSW